MKNGNVESVTAALVASSAGAVLGREPDEGVLPLAQRAGHGSDQAGAHDQLLKYGIAGDGTSAHVAHQQMGMARPSFPFAGGRMP